MAYTPVGIVPIFLSYVFSILIAGVFPIAGGNIPSIVRILIVYGLL
jgi:hypothetical protein